MADATIFYDTPMGGWPPTTYLVQLSEPMIRYDPETGQPAGSFEWVAVCCKATEPRGGFIFPSDEQGGFVDHTMIPMRRRDYGTVSAVLAQAGYTVV